MQRELSAKLTEGLFELNSLATIQTLYPLRAAKGGPPPLGKQGEAFAFLKLSDIQGEGFGWGMAFAVWLT